MKKFKIALCAVLVLLCGMCFAACGNKKQDFDTSKILLENSTFTYDGNSHVFTVKYTGDVNYSVLYSIDKSNFVKAEELGLKDVGAYNVYYKLIADGYNDYVPSEPVTFKIVGVPLSTADFSIEEKYINLSTTSLTSFRPRLVISNLLSGEDSSNWDAVWKFYKKPDSDDELGGEINLSSAQVGDTIIAKLASLNSPISNHYSFDLSEISFEINVVRNVYVSSSSSSTQWFDKLEDAVANAQDGTTITLYNNASLQDRLVLDKNLTITANAKDDVVIMPTVQQSNRADFANHALILVSGGKTVTLENLTINGKSAVRGISVDGAKLVLNNTKVQNGCPNYKDGEDNKNKLNGGVLLTGTSELTVNGGEIITNYNHYIEGGNEYGEDNEQKYCKDLWVGAQAKATIKGGANVGFVYVNANTYSQTNPDGNVQLTVEDATLNQVYLEYDGGYRASAELKEGAKVENLHLSILENKEIPLINPEIGKYVGGVALSSEKEGKTDYYTSLEDALQNGTNEVTLLCNLTTADSIEINEDLTIHGAGKSITASVSDNFTNLNGKETGKNGVLHIVRANVTLDNVVVDGNSAVRGIKLEDGTLTLMGGTQIKNCVGTTAAGAVYATGTSTVVVNDATINENNKSTANETTLENLTTPTDDAYFSADLWVGSQAQATLNADAVVGRVFVNSNNSASEPHGLTVDGATVESVWLEYDTTGATLTFTAGTITNLLVANLDGATAQKLTATSGTTYVGGSFVYANGTAYSSLEAALDAGETELVLYGNVEVEKTLKPTANLTISSASADEIFTIKANNNFTAQNGAREILRNGADDITITLSNIKLDGNGKVGCVYINSGKLILNNGATLTNGKANIDGLSNLTNPEYLNGGAYITGTAELEMNGGSISGNNNADKEGTEFGQETAYQYAKDLWVGSEAKATISGGEVENAWVNANNSSIEGAGLTITAGTITNLYVEYFENHSATATITAGTVDTLYLAQTSDEGSHTKYVTISNPSGTYNGGVAASVTEGETTTYYNSFSSAFNAVAANGTITLFADVETSEPIYISKSLTIDGGNGFAIKANGENFVAGTKNLASSNTVSYSIFILGADAAEVQFTLNNVTIDGANNVRAIAAFAGKVVLNGATIQNGAFIETRIGDGFSAGVFMSGESELVATNTTFENNNVYENDEKQEEAVLPYYKTYSQDLWIGSQAKATLNSGVTMGKVFVNANSHSTDNAGLTVDGATIDSVCLEYDKNVQKGGKCVYNSGSISQLFIISATGEVPEFPNNELQTGKTYIGGSTEE